MQMLCRLNDDEGNTSYHHNRPIIAQELIRLHPLDETPHLPTFQTVPKMMAGGAEIDCVLEMPGKERWTFAIKRSAGPSIAKGFYIACEDVKRTKKFVAYAGKDSFTLEEGLRAISLHNLMEEIRDRA